MTVTVITLNMVSLWQWHQYIKKEGEMVSNADLRRQACSSHCNFGLTLFKNRETAMLSRLAEIPLKCSSRLWQFQDILYMIVLHQSHKSKKLLDSNFSKVFLCPHKKTDTCINGNCLNFLICYKVLCLFNNTLFNNTLGPNIIWL